MGKFKNILGAIGLPLALAGMGFLSLTTPAQGQTSTCAQYLTINTTGTTPSYYVQTNYWNDGGTGCPGTTQCVTINNATGDFAVTAGDFACGNNVATYPSIVYGCQANGSCSNGTNLPMEVSLLQCVTSSWNIAVTNETGSDYWDAAYDIWFTSTNTNLTSHSAELMIWLNYTPGTGPGGSYVTDGLTMGNTTTTWRLNEGFNGYWNYIAYMADSNITAFNNVNILAFINDSVNRGYISSSWYLSAIEAGIEIRTGGVPFYSSGFSANVSSSCWTPTPTPTSTATPTSTVTPCGYPGNTCTPTVTPTPTATPSNLLVTYPNPWPSVTNPGNNIYFSYQNSQTEDEVSLKIFTLAFRKIYENDGLPTGQGTQTQAVNLVSMNLANGLYYFVVVTKNGGQQNQNVMKVLIRQ